MESVKSVVQKKDYAGELPGQRLRAARVADPNSRMKELAQNLVSWRACEAALKM